MQNVRSYQPKAGKTTQNQPKRPNSAAELLTKLEKNSFSLWCCVMLPTNRFFCHPDSGWSRDQPQPGSFFQRPREAEKRDPGNEVVMLRVYLSRGHEVISCLAIAPVRLSLIQS